MEEKLKIPAWFNTGSLMLAGVGVLTIAAGFLTNPQRTWANYLLNNFYFLSLAIGASFFAALQYITQSGWSSGFKRIPEAMAGFIPISAILFLFLFAGIPSIYHWAHQDAVAHDPLLLHKQPYLNAPFFMIRLVIFFAAWVVMTRLLRKFSLREDESGGLEYFRKSEFYSRIYIFILAITFSLVCFDLIMSVDPHWYSTLFAFKNFAAAFFHGSAIVLFIVLILNRIGYLGFFNRNHLQDFSSYVFMLSIIYGYLWFAQFMLIWYGNIPEETIYYAVRWENQWKFLFWADVIINWFLPFVILMPKRPARRIKVVLPVLVLLIVGQYIDLYLQIFPGVTGKNQLGWIELGSFIGFTGLFAFIVARNLASAGLVPKNHPYLGECLHHHL